jgi:hypothetical protein
MSALRLTLCLFASIACLAGSGCSGLRQPLSQGPAPGAAGTPALTPQAAMEAIEIGKSRKGDVAAQLGGAIVIAFDSGYEVWVYRWSGADRTPQGATELVLLFDPSGLATKRRLRPGEGRRP